MSVILDISMPRYCELCPLSSAVSGEFSVRCNILNRTFKPKWNAEFHTTLNVERPPDCPLSPVTEKEEL